MSWFRRKHGGSDYNKQGALETELPLGAESMISTQTAMELAASKPEASRQPALQPTQPIRGKPHYR